MKRNSSFVCVILIIAMALSSCALLHQHSFSAEWTYDAENHWNACLATAGCSERANATPHDFEVSVNSDGKTYSVCKTCGYHKGAEIEPGAHNHTFSDTYSSDTTMHWRECTASDCNQTTGASAHKYNSPKRTYFDGKLTTVGICEDCGFELTVTQDAKGGVISENHWRFVFERFSLTNFTVHIYISDTGYEEHTVCIVTENGIYQEIDGYKKAYIVKNDGVWVGYQKTYLANKFGTMKPDQSELEMVYESVCESATLTIPFLDNYDKFTYDARTGTFTSTEVLVATYVDSGDVEEIYCYNISVQIVNDKVISISADYRFSESADTESYRFVYESIGISSVNVPDYVINEVDGN